jgi:hypothetical protein
MTQAKHPNMYDVRTWAEYVNINFARSGEHLLDFRIISRLYDRQSGNFKACGWHVRLTFGSAFSGRSISVMILDTDLERSKLT